MGKLLVMKTPTKKKELKANGVKVSLTDAEYARLLAMAEEEGLGHSTVARRFVLQGLRKLGHGASAAA